MTFIQVFILFIVALRVFVFILLSSAALFGVFCFLLVLIYHFRTFKLLRAIRQESRELIATSQGLRLARQQKLIRLRRYRMLTIVIPYWTAALILTPCGCTGLYFLISDSGNKFDGLLLGFIALLIPITLLLILFKCLFPWYLRSIYKRYHKAVQCFECLSAKKT